MKSSRTSDRDVPCAVTGCGASATRFCELLAEVVCEFTGLPFSARCDEHSGFDRYPGIVREISREEWERRSAPSRAS